MATIVRGSDDELVERVKKVLDDYEQQQPGGCASLYRHNSASIRVRIVDDRFDGLSRAARHDQVWKFIADRLNDDDIQEISVLLLLSPKEQQTTFMNSEFDDPVPSTL